MIEEVVDWGGGGGIATFEACIRILKKYGFQEVDVTSDQKLQNAVTLNLLITVSEVNRYANTIPLVFTKGGGWGGGVVAKFIYLGDGTF